MRNDHKGKIRSDLDSFVTFYASGKSGQEVRADGNGGTLPRGYYMRHDTAGLFGPFGARMYAESAGRAYSRGYATIQEVERYATISGKVAA